MSTPINHHYVTQALSKNFMQNGSLFLYYKLTKLIKEKKSTKNLFSEDYLNSILNDNQILDHKSIENSLNENFEKDYTTHYNIVVNAINSPSKGEKLNILNSLKYLMGLGAIGLMRTPWGQAQRFDSLKESLTPIFEASEDLKQNFIKYEQERESVKNKSPLDYNQVRTKIFELMGETTFAALLAPDNEYFLLPDCTSIVFRTNLLDDVIHNGQILKSEGNSIASITFPINSKIALFCISKKIEKDFPSSVLQISKDEVYRYNLAFFNASEKGIVCESKEYLERFIASLNL